MATAPVPVSRRSWSAVTKDVVLSVGIGTVIGWLTSLGAPPRSRPFFILFGSLVGLGIFFFSYLLLTWIEERLEKLAGVWRTVAFAAVFFVSGCASWLVMGLLMQSLFDRTQVLGRGAFLFILSTGVIAVIIGLSLAGFERMRRQLEESVARLKEAEFAERELQLARGLQSRLLPPPEIEGDGYRVAARNLAARVVAGDFYDVFRLSDGALGLVVADVAGKGMAASLVMASVKAMLPLVAADRSAEETLRELNRRLAAELSPREFVALAYVRFDPARGSFVLANAGLPDPYRISPVAAPSPLVVPGPRLPLGIRREVAYESLSLSLEPGERLLLLTDGLPEAPTAAGEPLGYAALADLLSQDGAAPSPLAWLDGLLERLRKATAPALEDDWTALVLERAGPNP